MAIVSLKALLEAGVHFGHRTKRWNPKMRPYIFTERNGVHIIDLQQTVAQLEKAYNFIQDTVANGGVVLFVGTKRQAADIITTEAERCGMPYVNKRWLGGTLTNFRTIRARVDDMIELERRREYGEFNRLPKKEVLKLNEEIERLNRRVGGLRRLEALPAAVFVVDIRREDLAVKEATKLGIPLVAIVDTNCNPDPIDIVIPSNDDAIRAIRLMVGKMADAVLEGQAMRETLEAEEQEAAERSPAPPVMAVIDRELTDDELLGPSTLAKMEEGIGSDEPEEQRKRTKVTKVVSEVEEVAEVIETEAGEAEVVEIETVVAEVIETEAGETEVVETETVVAEVVETEEEDKN
ncbi:MAG TPA: 30S ribosomal protein S2 [Caldilineae bacterium]|nr:30S ribosomal protein S2 [Caldilineae bacterium]